MLDKHKPLTIIPALDFNPGIKMDYLNPSSCEGVPQTQTITIPAPDFNPG